MGGIRTRRTERNDSDTSRKPSTREVINNALDEGFYPATATFGAASFAKDPRALHAIDSLAKYGKEAYRSGKPILEALSTGNKYVRTLPVASSMLGSSVLNNGLKGMDIPFLMTLANIGGNYMYDKVTGAEDSPWGDIALDTGMDLGLLYGVGNATSKRTPLSFGGLTAASGLYHYFKNIKEREEKEKQNGERQ